MHNMRLKTLQMGHWDVQEFFYRKKGTFLHFQRAPGSSVFFQDFWGRTPHLPGEYAYSPGEYGVITFILIRCILTERFKENIWSVWKFGLLSSNSPSFWHTFLCRDTMSLERSRAAGEANRFNGFVVMKKCVARPQYVDWSYRGASRLTLSSPISLSFKMNIE